MEITPSVEPFTAKSVTSMACAKEQSEPTGVE
jgi:hypothetical protein